MRREAIKGRLSGLYHERFPTFGNRLVPFLARSTSTLGRCFIVGCCCLVLVVAAFDPLHHHHHHEHSWVLVLNSSWVVECCSGVVGHSSMCSSLSIECYTSLYPTSINAPRCLASRCLPMLSVYPPIADCMWFGLGGAHSM
jgi:hypothetical protein